MFLLLYMLSSSLKGCKIAMVTVCWFAVQKIIIDQLMNSSNYNNMDNFLKW